VHPPSLPVPPGVALEAIDRFGSPVYVYAADVLRASYRTFTAAFPYAPADFHYAIVCNKNRYLTRCLVDLGAGIHANTPGDAHAALAAGVPADRIVYSGTNLDRDDFQLLLSRSIRMNLDSLDQLRDLAALGGSGPVGLRLLIDSEERPNRIGVAPGELAEAREIARGSAGSGPAPKAAAHPESAPGLRLAGLHIYCGTNTLDPRRFLAGLDRMIAASDELPDLEYLDIGGGFGFGYGDGESGLPIDPLGRAVAQRMEAVSARRVRRVRLLVEPGRAVVAASGILLMRVVSVKERGRRRYVGVDSTVGNLAAESVYHMRHRIVPVAPRGEPLSIPTDVCGNTTHSRDYLGRRLLLPEVRKGDVLALLDVGAYAYAMSSHFLNRPRPPEVVADRGELFLTTRRETLADLLDTQVDVPVDGRAEAASAR
jgi:diaminopimelate decarboxylase